MRGHAGRAVRAAAAVDRGALAAGGVRRAGAGKDRAPALRRAIGAPGDLPYVPRHEARPPATWHRRSGTGCYLPGQKLKSCITYCWLLKPVGIQQDTASNQHQKAAVINVRQILCQIREAVEVLDKLNPLKHVATVRKSQVQHALAEMLTSMLGHSVAVDEPRSGSLWMCHRNVILFCWKRLFVCLHQVLIDLLAE